MTIQAIETRYAGHRFRSRLEARWAIFLDHIGVPWEYEVEGYTIGRGTSAGDIWKGPYLPDFQLRGRRWSGWLEVKGEPTVDDVRKAAAAAHPDGGLPGGEPIHLVGPFGRPGQYPPMVALFHRDGEIYCGRPWDMAGSGGCLVSEKRGFDSAQAVRVVEWWKTPGPYGWQYPGEVEQALSARFEHGEAS